jgi:hypothetical protein
MMLNLLCLCVFALLLETLDLCPNIVAWVSFMDIWFRVWLCCTTNNTVFENVQLSGVFAVWFAVELTDVLLDLQIFCCWMWLHLPWVLRLLVELWQSWSQETL